MAEMVDDCRAASCNLEESMIGTFVSPTSLEFG